MRKLKLYLDTFGKATKSLQEVWDWKEKVYEETKGLSIEEAARKIQKDADEIFKKHGLKIRTVHTLRR